MQIAKLLTAEHILTVKAHYAQRAGKPLPEKPYHWDPKSVGGSWNGQSTPVAR